jgi:hypothetical protein
MAATQSKPTKKSSSATQTPKTQARSQDSMKLGFSAEPTPPPSDPSAARLQSEQDELQQPGRASKTDAEQIDNEPGYNKDQLDHMREYWGLKDSTAEVAEV